MNIILLCSFCVLVLSANLCPRVLSVVVCGCSLCRHRCPRSSSCHTPPSASERAHHSIRPVRFCLFWCLTPVRVYILPGRHRLAGFTLDRRQDSSRAQTNGEQ